MKTSPDIKADPRRSSALGDLALPTSKFLALFVAAIFGPASGVDPALAQGSIPEIEARGFAPHQGGAAAAPERGTTAPVQGKVAGIINLRIGPQDLPPRGLCRAWIPGRAPERQAPPQSCAALRVSLPAGAILLDRGIEPAPAAGGAQSETIALPVFAPPLNPAGPASSRPALTPTPRVPEGVAAPISGPATVDPEFARPATVGPIAAASRFATPEPPIPGLPVAEPPVAEPPVAEPPGAELAIPEPSVADAAAPGLAAPGLAASGLVASGLVAGEAALPQRSVAVVPEPAIIRAEAVTPELLRPEVLLPAAQTSAGASPGSAEPEALEELVALAPLPRRAPPRPKPPIQAATETSTPDFEAQPKGPSKAVSAAGAASPSGGAFDAGVTFESGVTFDSRGAGAAPSGQTRASSAEPASIVQPKLVRVVPKGPLPLPTRREGAGEQDAPTEEPSVWSGSYWKGLVLGD